MNAAAFWQAVDAQLAAGQCVFIALVVANTRGSPGTAGARLLLGRDDRPRGTIGGGVMEANVLAAARRALACARRRPQIQRLVHRKTGGAHASGLVCDGEQTNLTAVLEPATDRDAVAGFVAALADDAVTAAALRIDPRGVHLDHAEPKPDGPGQRLVETETGWSYAEQSVARRRLAIVGGGHCGQALAQLAATLGYRIDVYDTRAAILADARWPETTHRHVIADFGCAGAELCYPGLTRVVVMTTAMPSDVEALAALAPRNWRWLGVMGSRAKTDLIRRSLRARGLESAAVDAVHGPIGLPMKSDTPEEIAISILGALLASERADAERVGA